MFGWDVVELRYLYMPPVNIGVNKTETGYPLALSLWSTANPTRQYYLTKNYKTEPHIITPSITPCKSMKTRPVQIVYTKKTHHYLPYPVITNKYYDIILLTQV